MAKENRAAQAASNESESPYPRPLVRRLAGFLLVFHFGVVLLAQLRLDDSPLAINLMRYLMPYVDVAAISRGYAFFAPNPGEESFLVDYEIEFDDGRVEEGRYPDLEKHWPRLLYHRHFMLSSQWAGMYRGLDPPRKPENATPDSDAERAWQADYANWQAFFDHGHSYARHLLRRHHASEVRLVLVRHRVPSHDEFIRGTSLTDLALYDTLGSLKGPSREPLIVVRREEVDAVEVSP